MFQSQPERWYRWMLWKAYFDEGYGFTSYVKYLIAIIGISNVIINKNIWFIIVLGLGYGVFCFVIGIIIYHSGMKDAMHEVQNKVNPFVKEMRKVYK